MGLLDSSDPHHDWTVAVAPRARGPWLTAEACIVEAVHCLAGKALPARARLFDWMDRDLLISQHALPERRGMLMKAAGEQGAALDWELLADYLKLFQLEFRLSELKETYGKTH